MANACPDVIFDPICFNTVRLDAVSYTPCDDNPELLPDIMTIRAIEPESLSMVSAFGVLIFGSSSRNNTFFGTFKFKLGGIHFFSRVRMVFIRLASPLVASR